MLDVVGLLRVGFLRSTRSIIIRYRLGQTPNCVRDRTGEPLFSKTIHVYAVLPSYPALVGSPCEWTPASLIAGVIFDTVRSLRSAGIGWDRVGLMPVNVGQWPACTHRKTRPVCCHDRLCYACTENAYAWAAAYFSDTSIDTRRGRREREIEREGTYYMYHARRKSSPAIY